MYDAMNRPCIGGVSLCPLPPGVLSLDALSSWIISRTSLDLGVGMAGVFVMAACVTLVSPYRLQRKVGRRAQEGRS